MSTNRYLYLLVFVVGTASLGAEIAAARLMAPFFGASTIVWANTIAVVLVALSAGYWLGGRFADRRPDIRSLCLVVLAASLLLAVVPLIARPFFDLSVDALDQIEAGAFVGSLFAVLFLIAIPIVLLGTCSPWALRLAVGDVEHAGRVSGRLYAISTVGSLTGTMLAALVLIPLAGTQRTFLAFALALALVAVGGLGWRFAVVPLALAGAIALPVGTVKAVDQGRVLYEDESEQQYIRVVEEDDGDRTLELNEGQAVHSILPAKGFLTADYWDSFLVLPFAAADRPPQRVAILGNAAGTIAREYGHFWPRAEIDGVEIDPELSEVGYRYFDMGSNPNLSVHTDDARPWLRQANRRLRPDRRRRLPPALHPVLPRDQGVLRARPGPPRTRRRRRRQRRSPGGQRTISSRCSERRWRRSSRPCCATPPSRPTRCCSAATPPASAARLARAARTSLHGNLAELAKIDAAQTRPAARRRRGLHRRPRPGRVADRQVDPRLRRGPLSAQRHRTRTRAAP